MPIIDYCSTDVITIGSDENLLTAARMMRDQHVGSLVVAENGAPVGIITDRDIVVRGVAEEKDLRAICVQEVMSCNLLTASKDAGVFEVTSLMCDEGIRRLPIVDGGGRLVGLVALDDLLVVLGTELANLASISSTERYREAEKVQAIEYEYGAPPANRNRKHQK
jgi:CBS domain-containing protein